MSGELDELARAAANALVAAMVTDSWERVRRRFAALVGHERRMDAAHDEIAASSAADRDRLLQEQAQAWTTRLVDVLDDDPAAAEGLRALLAELGAALPAVTPVLQQVRADHSSQAVNVGGSITGNAGEVYVGVGKVDKRTVNRFFAPFIFLGRAVKQAAAAHAATTAVVVVVLVLGMGAIAGWRAHWPPAIFGKTVSSGATASVSSGWSKLRWTAAEAPRPAGLPGAGSFDGVACPAPRTCLTAGPYTDSSSNYRRYGILTDTASHGKWAPATYVPIDMGGSADQPVHGLACAAAGNCMTVGEWLNPSSGYYTGLVDTLSNGAWRSTQLSLPANAGQDQEVELHAIACPAVGNCVVVGSNYPSSGNSGWGLIQTLADGTWTAIEAPLPTDAAKGDKAGGDLYGVTCTAPGACVAVGFYTQADGASRGLIETLRNGTWTPTAAPPLPGESGQVWLAAVSCATTTSCVAVGYISGREGLIETLANGTWHSSVAPVPKDAAGLGPEQLSGVACPAVGACVAVGNAGTNQKSQGVIDTLADGTWTAATAPLPANAAATAPAAGLSVVACATVSYCVASGGYTDDTHHGQALIESTTPIATAASTPTAGTTPAEGLTRTFPDGTKVSFISAEWAALPQYDQAPYGVKFTFRIVAGPQWSNPAKVHLCANCGNGRPYEYYMVTIAGWAYPDTNNTGYADLASGITTAQGVPKPINTGVAAWLSAGDSVSTSSTLIPPSGSPGEQRVTVTIEMPDTTLASETFMVNVSPDPNGPQP